MGISVSRYAVLFLGWFCVAMPVARAQETSPNEGTQQQPAATDSAVITTTVDAAPAIPAPPAAAPSTVTIDAAAAGAQVKDLSAVLGGYADANVNARVWGSVVSLTAAAVVIPASVVLIDRDTDPTLYYISLGVGIGAAVSGLLNLFIGGSDFETILEHHRERIARGESAAQVALETEAEWSAAAQNARSLRKFSGITGLITSAVFLGAGALLAVADPIDGSEFRDQYDVSSLLLTVGALSAVGASQVLFIETPIESSYRAFSRGRGFLGNTKVSVAPTRGGVMFAMGTRF